jgi:hypothetical protein
MTEYKSNMTLRVEFLAGTSIKEAILESAIKCRELNLAYVCFNFNGVSISIQEGSCAEKGEAEYNKALESGQNYIVLRGF